MALVSSRLGGVVGCCCRERRVARTVPSWAVGRRASCGQWVRARRRTWVGVRRSLGLV